MKSIFSCKLYKSSTRKDKIRAALINPINKELVQQLESYLGDSQESEEFDIDTTDTSTSGGRVKRSGSSHSYSGGVNVPDTIDSPTVADLGEEGAEDENLPEGDLEDEIVDESEPENDSDGQEELPEDEVSEASNIPTDPQQPKPDMSTAVQAIFNHIKTGLNESEFTAGVNRILSKSDEVWIYYNDSINLNNVMGSVIEFVSQSYSNMMDFNRLARSENAIVFQINQGDEDGKTS